MRLWDVYLPDVEPWVIGLPSPAMERALCRAAQTFCAKSGVWQIRLDGVKTTANNVMDFDIPREAEIVKVTEATIADQPLGFGDSSTPRIVTSDARTFSIEPPPAAGLSVVVAAWLRPSLDATGIPNDIGDRYGESFAWGALASLLLQPGETYNAGLAESYRLKFNEAIASAQTHVWRKFTSNRPRAKGQFF
jgi:hypothetical protein